MSFDAGTILGRLKLDRSGFTSGILESQGLTKLLGTSISSFLANPLVGVANIAVSAVKGIKDLVMGTMNAAVEFERLSKTSGASVEWLSAVSYACKQADMPAEQVAESFNQLVRGVREAASGVGPAANAFRDLGINIHGADGQLRPTQELFMQIADKMKGIENPTLRAATAQEIFGRSGMKLLPILSQGSAGIEAQMAKAKELGVVFDGKSAEGAENFHHALVDMGEALRGLGIQVVTPLFTALAPVVETLAMSLGGALKPVIQQVGAVLIQLMPIVSQVLNSLGSVLGPILEQSGQLFAQLAPPIMNLVKALADALLPCIGPIFDIFKALSPLLIPIIDLVGQLAKVFSGVLAPVLKLLAPILNVIATILGAIVKVISAVVGGIGDALGDMGSALGLKSGPQFHANVTAMIDPEASARAMNDQMQPALVNAVRGSQYQIESSTRRRADLMSFEQRLGAG